MRVRRLCSCPPARARSAPAGCPGPWSSGRECGWPRSPRWHVYGAIRWATLLSPGPGWRLVGLLGVAVGLAGVGSRLERYRTAWLAVLGLAGALVGLAIAGIPVRWITHLRIEVTANAVGLGVSALPRALVPYNGVNQWLRMVIVSGAGALLLAAGLLLASAPRPLSDARRAATAVPLVALAVVPSTLVRPALPYVQGLILFVLVAAFMWGERLHTGELGIAGGLAALAGVAGMVAAPRIESHSPWLNYEALAGNLAPAHIEAFDWTQRYGPLHWPRQGREVLDVQAPHGDYWKAQNLDVFDGRGWVNASVEASDAQDTVDPVNLDRWTQTLHVTLRAMRTTSVIASGLASAPEHTDQSLSAGDSDGTWTVAAGLGPGDSYTVSTYDPHPSPAQLATAGTNYPGAILPAYVSLSVPQGNHPAPAAPAPALTSTVTFAPFGVAGAAPYGSSTSLGAAVLRASPYARTYALAQRLARGAATPYEYVLRVQHYLQRGYRYDEQTPNAEYPIETFLFKTRAGYCQQFAGAMALLLRMGGVPARVSVGFTPGSYNTTTHAWVVSDVDAHAWVEVWFPHYGWIRFDPTPAVDPALGGHVPLPAIKSTGSGSSSSGPTPHGLRSGTPAAASRPHGGGGSSVAPFAALAVVLGLLAVALRATVRFSEPSGDQLLGELERALRRSGRPIGAGTTLAALEQRFRSSAEAAAYIRVLRLARYGGADQRPSPAQRRALRSQLRAGLGFQRLRPGTVGAAPAPDRAASRAEPIGPGPTLHLMDDVYELFRRGTELLEAGHNHQATIPLSRARDLAPDKTSIREALGRALFHAQRYEQAAAEFEAVIERAPTNDYALFCLGRSLQLLGRHAEARKPLALAACLQPGRRDYRIYRDRARAAAARS